MRQCLCAVPQGAAGAQADDAVRGIYHAVQRRSGSLLSAGAGCGAAEHTLVADTAFCGKHLQYHHYAQLLPGVPNALYEAASIDGCSYFKYFLRILLPISLPSIATITLFYAVSYWNAYFYSILFITDRTKYPIQAILRQILMSSEFNTLLYDDAAQSMPSEMLKCAMIVITALPIICVYPFLQRYFVKGVMVGSLKG